MDPFILIKKNSKKKKKNIQILRKFRLKYNLLKDYTKNWKCRQLWNIKKQNINKNRFSIPLFPLVHSTVWWYLLLQYRNHHGGIF